MSEKLKCPDCGAELASDAASGMCVPCALKKVLQSDSSTSPDKSLQSTIHLSFPLTEKPGDKIGNYKLHEQIGEGGCGVVYSAEQKEPIRRKVALKVIKLGMDTKQVVARFEAERQALAMMDHPNIAKVLDAGATETGRPFFVMELVRGIKITDYCDKHQLSTEERLKLFVQVCHAIQHAHQKGIIHRDIKPSNILVTLHDGVPVPKVIDFGIAKATTGQPLSDKTIFTAFEQFIGTPAYMSPEQAEMSGLDIDTRTDVYALGVLLYELLTGKTPFDAKELFAKGLDEVRRIIREEEPPRPSTRLSTLDAGEQTTLSKLRQSEPPKLLGIIRGDLDWIVVKTLEKDRTRRYETANGLAMDIERYLKSELVLARPPSRLYRFQKMIRRNKIAATVSISFIVVILIALSLTLFLLRQEQAARRRAVAAEQAEKQMRKQAELRQYEASGQQFVSQGKLDEAVVAFRTALEIERSLPAQDQTSDSVVNLANALQQRGELAEAEQLLVEKLSLLRSTSTNRVYSMSPTLGRTLLRLAEVIRAKGEIKAARKLAEEANSQYVQNTTWPAAERRQSYQLLASILIANDDLAALKLLCVKSLVKEKEITGKEDLAVSAWFVDVMTDLLNRGRFNEAEEIYREVALRGFPSVQFALGKLYREDMIYGIHYIPEALKFYRMAAEAGHVEAQVALGDIYFKGEGVPQDQTEGLNWYRKAGEQGHAKIQLVLGRMLISGEGGLPINESEGIKWLLKASKTSQLLQYYAAGMLLFDGEEASTNRLFEGVKMIRECAENGNPEAQTQLGHLFRRGLGVTKDIEQAIAWYRKALVEFPGWQPVDPNYWKDALDALINALASQRKQTELEDLFSKTLLTEQNKFHRAQFLYSRGNFRAYQDKWQEALEDLEFAKRTDPTENNYWYPIAPALLRVGKQSDFRKHCEEMIGRLSVTNEPSMLARSATAAMLLPTAEETLHQAAHLATAAIEADPQHKVDPDCIFAKGLSEYRQGRFESAAGYMRRILATPPLYYHPPIPLTAAGVPINLKTKSIPKLIDWNGDGVLDLLVASGDGYLWLYQQLGGASSVNFSEGKIVATPAEPIRIGRAVFGACFVDMDGDGLPDIVGAGNDNRLQFLKNIGSRSVPAFAKSVFVRSGNGEFVLPPGVGGRIDLADWDQDGLVDLITGGLEGYFTYYRNTGTTTMPAFDAPGVRLALNYSEIRYPHNTHPKVYDFDNDGLLDLVFGINWGDVFVLYNSSGRGATNFSRQYQFQFTNNTPLNIRTAIDDDTTPDFGDLNGDGVDDLISGGLNGQLFFMAGTANSSTAKMTRYSGHDARALIVLSMAQKKLNQLKTARMSLLKGSNLFEARPTQFNGGDMGSNWYNALTTQILLNEAKELLEMPGLQK